MQTNNELLVAIEGPALTVEAIKRKTSLFEQVKTTLPSSDASIVPASLLSVIKVFKVLLL